MLGEFDYVEALVKAGSNVNAKNNDGVTPLMDACESLNGPTIEFLLDSGKFAKLKCDEYSGDPNYNRTSLIFK